MAKCGYCDLEMTTATGCPAKVSHPHKSGQSRPPIPYGHETRYALLTVKPVGTPEERALQYQAECREKPCHDCNAVYGEFHHPGCDVEECPWCGKQALGCDCHPMSTDDSQSGRAEQERLSGMSDTDKDIYLEVEHRMTPEERSRFLEEVHEFNPRLRGAKVADVLAMMHDADSCLNLVEPATEKLADHPNADLIGPAAIAVWVLRHRYDLEDEKLLVRVKELLERCPS